MAEVASKSSGTLPGPVALLKEAWELGKSRYWAFAGIFFLIILINFGIFLGLGAIGLVSFFVLRDVMPVFIAVAIFLAIVFVVASVYLSLRQSASFVVLFRDAAKRVGVMASFRESKPFVLPLFLTGILNTLIVFGGIMALIIPGIILSIWFAFYRFIVVIEKKNGLLALYQSREYLRERFFPVVWRAVAWYLLIYGVWIVLSLISGEDGAGVIELIMQLLLFVLTPIIFAYNFVLYQHLRKTGKSVDAVSAKAKRWFMIFPIIGVLLIVALFFIFGSLLTMLPEMFQAADPSFDKVQESVITIPPEATGAALVQ